MQFAYSYTKIVPGSISYTLGIHPDASSYGDTYRPLIVAVEVQDGLCKIFFGTLRPTMELYYYDPDFYTQSQRPDQYPDFAEKVLAPYVIKELSAFLNRALMGLYHIDPEV